MLTIDRRSQILEILRQNGSVTVSKLAEDFETSESTIRRDLLALSQLGKIKRFTAEQLFSVRNFFTTRKTLTKRP